MKVPFLDLKAQLEPIESDVKRAINEVVDSTWYIGGPKVTEIEQRVAEYVGASHGVGMTSGTDALLASLMALGVGAGDVVVVPAYSFFATAGVVSRLCATPAFVDIDPDTYNIDPSALGAWFDANAEAAGKVKAIIPVHLYGQCADMDAILDVARERGIAVVEDAAQAIGSKYPSSQGVKRAGSMGTTGCLSFYPTKNLSAMGDGGMVVTNDGEMAEALLLLRDHGQGPKYHHSVVGANFRLDAMQAAVLLVKLPHLESWHAGRRANAAHYDANLAIAGVKTPAVVYDRDSHIYNQYIISVPERRDELRAFLTDNDVGTEIYYPIAFHEQGCFEYLGYSEGAFPASEYAARHTLALPIYTELTDAMQDYVIEKIGEFYG